MPEPSLLASTAQKELRRKAHRVVGRVAERIHEALRFVRGYDLARIAARYEVDPGAWRPAWNVFAPTG